jgi:hypothetical protein
VIEDPAEYCRRIETYLCGKNEGHLIRIVGPAFEMVCGWARQGVPLKVAFRGIDHYCERYYAKGSRRRPVRIEFCEADILDLFDGWRRAVGVTSIAGDGPVEPAPRKPGLASHIERVIARLTSLRAGGQRSPAFDQQVADAVRELDGLAADARHVRGGARETIVDRLAALDRALMETATGELDAAARADLRVEAERELAAFGARMAPDARARSVDAAFARLVREALGLPSIRYE